MAAELGARSVAFPLISAGAYGWPVAEAIDTAVEVLAGADQPRGGAAGAVAARYLRAR